MAEKGIGLLIGLKPKSQDEDGEIDDKAAAKKALFKAIVKQDQDAFNEAIDLLFDACMGEEEEDEGDDAA